MGARVPEKREAIMLANWDSTIALMFALTINASILILAAATFHKAGRTDVAELSEVHSFLAPLLGSALAPTLFGIALLCCGLNSTVTATLAGQIVMEGFLDIRLPPWMRRLATRALAIIPAAAVTIWWGSEGTAKLLILSQVVLSLQLPFAIVPLVMFTADKRKMGALVAPRWMTGLAARRRGHGDRAQHQAVVGFLRRALAPAGKLGPRHRSPLEGEHDCALAQSVRGKPRTRWRGAASKECHPSPFPPCDLRGSATLPQDRGGKPSPTGGEGKLIGGRALARHDVAGIRGNRLAMRFHLLLPGLAAAALLGSCATAVQGPADMVHRITSSDPTKAYLGMTKEELIACAGQPHSRYATAPGSETLSYHYSGAGPVPSPEKDKGDKGEQGRQEADGHLRRGGRQEGQGQLRLRRELRVRRRQCRADKLRA